MFVNLVTRVSGRLLSLAIRVIVIWSLDIDNVAPRPLSRPW